MTTEKYAIMAANNFETSVVQQIARSERRAWRVAGAACAVALCQGVAIVVMMPLKESVPHLVREDAMTGAVQIVTVLNEDTITSEEARDMRWMRQYVAARERYNAHTLQDDYTEVVALSSKSVAAEYDAAFDEPDAPNKRFGSRVEQRVEITSVVPTSATTGTVRFRRDTRRVGIDEPPESKEWVATIAFDYHVQKRLDSDRRSANPFGFQVTAYRLDTEFGAGSDR